MNDEKVRENKMRRWAKRLGLWLKKSRARMFSLDNRGGYMIIDPYTNTIGWGERFDLTLDDVEEILKAQEEEAKKRK